MAGVVTYDKYLDSVRKSGLIKPERFDALVAEFRAERSGASPDASGKRSGASPDASGIGGGSGSGSAIATGSDDGDGESMSLARWLELKGLLTGWQNKKLLAGKYKGFFLDKYKILGHLGTGGMSSVYLAEHVLMQRKVAIKVLPTARVGDSSYLDRFFREARAVAGLDHPNIVQAFSADNDKNTYYIVMEYVVGRDLEKLVADDGPLPYETAVEYIRQAADGLAHAHGRNMIHRDIKPANLLLDDEGTVKILDMGLARLTGVNERNLTIEQGEKVLGTTDYLPPEQAINSAKIDHRADIYSLGGTLYFLLTGHPPFCEGTMAQRLLMHQIKEPPCITKDRADCPADLLAVCKRMMAKKPDDRYQSCDDLRDELTAWLQSRGVDKPLKRRGSASPGLALRDASARSDDSGSFQLRRGELLKTESSKKAAYDSDSSSFQLGSSLHAPEPALQGFLTQMSEDAETSSILDGRALMGSSIAYGSGLNAGSSKGPGSGKGSGRGSSVSGFSTKNFVGKQNMMVWIVGGGAAAALALGLVLTLGLGVGSADARDGGGGASGGKSNGSLAAKVSGPAGAGKDFAMGSPFPIGRRHDALFDVKSAGPRDLTLRLFQCPDKVAGTVFLNGAELKSGIPLVHPTGGPQDIPLGVHPLVAGSNTFSVELRSVGQGAPSFLTYDSWYVAGPFDNKGLGHKWPPETEGFQADKEYDGKNNLKIRWSKRSFTNGHSISMNDQFPVKDNITYYLFRTIKSTRDADVAFYVSSDDQCKVFINGQTRHEHNSGRGVTPYSDRVSAKLKKGDNQFLFKVCQSSGDTGFFFADHPSSDSQNFTGPMLEFGVAYPPAK